MIVGDVIDAPLLATTARDCDVLVHLAGQVAVTTSVTNPRQDFEANALGTFNALEAARLSDRKPIFIYASTNKVYGEMQDVRLVEEATRWKYADLEHGCSEAQPLDFHSPYGCSKGAGDQYVRDYARIYGLQSVVLRQSCIYGPRQFGMEDQGWLAWMTIAAVTGRPITIYGDGKQVRDVLHVDDLLDAYDAAISRIETARGQVYNVGGGTRNILAVWAEFGPLLEKVLGRKIPVSWADWRPGDQRVFYADFRKAQKELGWTPRVESAGRHRDACPLGPGESGALSSCVVQTDEGKQSRASCLTLHYSPAREVREIPAWDHAPRPPLRSVLSSTESSVKHT